MRIYALTLNKKIDNVILYLTSEEAGELKDALEKILISNEKYHHVHINDDDYKREITVCVYKKDDLSSFDERSKKLILEDD